MIATLAACLAAHGAVIMRKAKIVCTMGPSTAGVPRLVELISAGMDVARLNFSHGDHDAHRLMYANVRAAARQVGRPLAVIADLSGPKIRVGKMNGGQVSLVEGAMITLTSHEVEGTAARVSHSYAPLARDVRAGESILLDDGLLELVVEAITGDDVRCRVKVGGPLKDHKGMNLPGTKLSTAALTDKDRADITFARELGVDFFALSFVRRPADLVEAKTLCGDVPVIAKIEMPEAIERLDEVLDASDGVMVARGDLGVELGHEKVPLVQKRIIRSIKLRAKPVITATQMLESMIGNPSPTRAEVSDVANAVLDGTDAVMLSGETSVGKYPVETVRTMGRIIDEIEGSPLYSATLDALPNVQEHTFSNAIAHALSGIVASLGLKAVVVYSESGRAARLVSADRPAANVICFSRHDNVLNRMALYWGVKPLHGDWVHGVAGVVEQAERELLRHELVRPGDEIAITFGMVLGDEPFQTNMLKLWRIRG
jgi:pyruvate kinase